MDTSQSTTKRSNTVVIGGGQAGLATGYHLGQRGIDHVILEAADRLGSSWRDRWDSLRLFTFAKWGDLPGMQFPAAKRHHFPSKDEVADFLEQYASKFSLPVKLGVKVQRVSRAGNRYLVEAGSERYEADNVVVATGPFQKPRLPDFADQLGPAIRQMHSSAYHNPGDLADGDTLVVGAATSGAQIAMELAARGRKTYLSGRSVDAFPPAKVAILGRTLMPWVYRRPKESFIGKKLRAKVLSQGHPLIGFTYKDVEKTGVERVGRTAGIEGGKPKLDDGRVLEVANVIWCTGYWPDFSWIDLDIFEESGYPRHNCGVVESEPGLYFVGLIFLQSLASQLMLGVPRDTKHVTEELVRRSAASASPAVVEQAPATAGAARS
jgi:putative flavoprotein involved in K+ transport